MKLVELSPKGIFVFVGDTHGDLYTSKKIIEKYAGKGVRFVFLGDYVNRGYFSRGNINFLLSQREKHPRKVYLEQGNHEGHLVQDSEGYLVGRVDPADFWKKLTPREAEKYDEIFRGFPLAISIGNIIATHSALPRVSELSDINNIKDGDKNWGRMVWLDVADNTYYPTHRRGCIRTSEFNSKMARFGKDVLIRSHDWEAPESMFNGRCLTLFTSRCYDKRDRMTVAIADFTRKKQIRSVDDLIIEEV